MNGSIDSGSLPEVIRLNPPPPRGDAITKPSPSVSLRGSVEPGAAVRGESGDKPAGSEVDEAVGKINEFVQMVQRNLEFSVDDDTGRTVVKVINAESGEVVRQIPPEEVLGIAENLEDLKGILFRGQA